MRQSCLAWIAVEWALWVDYEPEVQLDVKFLFYCTTVRSLTKRYLGRHELLAQ